MFLKISIYHQWNTSRIYFLSKYIYIYRSSSNPVTRSKSKGLKFNVARYAKAWKLATAIPCLRAWKHGERRFNGWGRKGREGYGECKKGEKKRGRRSVAKDRSGPNELEGPTSSSKSFFSHRSRATILFATLFFPPATRRPFQVKAKWFSEERSCARSRDPRFKGRQGFTRATAPLHKFDVARRINADRSARPTTQTFPR